MPDITLSFTEPGGRYTEFKLKFDKDPDPGIFELVRLVLRASNIYQFRMEIYSVEKSQHK